MKGTQTGKLTIAKGGDKLAGEMILEIPVQKVDIPPSVLERANNLGVKIRDIAGNIYK